jgi:hypothetical protein
MATQIDLSKIKTALFSLVETGAPCSVLIPKYMASGPIRDRLTICPAERALSDPIFSTDFASFPASNVLSIAEKVTMGGAKIFVINLK